MYAGRLKAPSLFLISRQRGALVAHARSLSAAPGGPLSRYEHLVAAGELIKDEHQLAALEKLDGLHKALVDSDYEPPKEVVASSSVSKEPGLGVKLGRLASGWGIALGGGSENPSGAGGVKVSIIRYRNNWTVARSRQDEEMGWISSSVRAMSWLG